MRERGAPAELARGTGLHLSVAAPIVVEGRLWGLITASWKGEQSPPADTEQRMSRFAQLLDTAIANAEARAELVASRARLVAASDEARRRFERDLHDGVQQRLVSLALELRSAEAIAPPDNEELAEQLTHVGKGLADALDDLRELSRGIHPAILSEGGLVPALKALARRSAVPVQLDLAIGGAVRRARGDRGVLRRLGGPHERRKARPRLKGGGARACARRCARAQDRRRRRRRRGPLAGVSG